MGTGEKVPDITWGVFGNKGLLAGAVQTAEEIMNPEWRPAAYVSLSVTIKSDIHRLTDILKCLSVFLYKGIHLHKGFQHSTLQNKLKSSGLLFDSKE